LLERTRVEQLCGTSAGTLWNGPNIIFVLQVKFILCTCIIE